MSILKDEDGQPVPPLKLDATKYLPSLAGVVWDEEEENSLPAELRLILKRAKINVSIILRESDENTKYDLFQRLNTGGSQASDQEVRNCLLVMLNKPLYRWMKELSDEPGFVETVALSERPIQEAYDLELVLRFLILYNIEISDLNSIGDVGIFLTDKMREIAANENFDREAAANAFRQTFGLINDQLSDSAFKRYDIQKQRFMGAFQISQFEVVACGIGFNMVQGHEPTDLPEKVKGLWQNETYTSWTGSGITAARRLPRLIPLGREIFSS